MKQAIKKIMFGLLYAAIIAAISIGGSLLIGGLLFGRVGVNELMVDATNLLMGILGTPVIILLTTRYYQKYANQALSQVDFFYQKQTKRLLVGLLIGFAMVGLLVSLLWLSGAEVIPQRLPRNWLSFLGNVIAFVGMAVLEECVFRGVLRQAFSFCGEIIASSVAIGLFAAMHMELWSNFDLVRLIELLAGGLLFTVILSKSKSLAFTSAVHVSFNITSTMIFGIESESGFLSTNLTGPCFGLAPDQIGSIYSILVSVLCCLLFSLVFKRCDKLKNL